MSFRVLQTMATQEPTRATSEHMIRTRDGAQLATDVYIPAGHEPDGKTYSAILARTCYDKSSDYTGLKYEAESFNARGFIFVAQDVRGKFRSTGATEPYTYDVDDAYDTVDWIVAQPWSNGKVGLVGASYYGFTAWAGVACGHPAVKAAIPQVTGINMGQSHVAPRADFEIPFHGSLSDILQIWTNNKGYLAEIDYGKSAAEIIADAEKAIGPSRAAQRFLKHTRHMAWYNPYGDRHPYYTTNIPVLHWQSWYDPGLCPSGMRDWRYFHHQPSTTGLHYLRVASEDHSAFRLEDVGKGREAHAYFSDAAVRRKQAVDHQEMADFFDEHVNGVEPTRPRAHARWHIGHLGWQETRHYPPKTEAKVFHLTRGHDKSIHCLSPQGDAKASSLTWTHDPENPVPSTHDIESIWFLLLSYPDEKDQVDRPDVLTFRTEALLSDLVFVGQPMLTAELSYTANTTHLFVKLQDVYPDGTTRPISWCNTVLRKTQSCPVRLTLDDNAYRYRKGHRVQLHIAASNFPFAAPHPGTDENPWTATQKIKAEHSLTVGGIDGATLELPTVDIGSLSMSEP
ncbi:hypothetical protein FDECE_13037 [Fusarium decemcellulare]|nr:hypothetical protein FDECE_13037 [Fusarium decemcellulare]